MASTRLPGKVLTLLHDRPILEWVVRRTMMTHGIDQVVVATTINLEDDAVAAFCAEAGFALFRGSQDDVLERFHLCAQEYAADVIVRVTADDPLKDAEIIGEAIKQLLSTGADYCSNTIHPTYPEGLDIEVFTATALARAYAEARLPSEHEHVTPYIWKNPDRFRIEELAMRPDRSGWRWTVDNPADLIFVDTLLAAAGPRLDIGYRDLIAAVERSPDLMAMCTNKTIRNEGYLKSISEEQKLS